MSIVLERKHVLLVEDEEDQAELLEYAFKSKAEWAKLTIVNTIQDARSALSASQPDLLITDLRLPDGDGRELLSRERTQQADFSLKNIIKFRWILRNTENTCCNYDRQW